MSLKLVLFSTDHCSRCDEALDMLLSMPELAGCAVDVVDIAGNPELLATFGERIPVLMVRCAHADSTVQLDWPFDSADIFDSIGQVE